MTAGVTSQVGFRGGVNSLAYSGLAYACTPTSSGTMVLLTFGGWSKGLDSGFIRANQVTTGSACNADVTGNIFSDGRSANSSSIMSVSTSPGVITTKKLCFYGYTTSSGMGGTNSYQSDAQAYCLVTANGTTFPATCSLSCTGT